MLGESINAKRWVGLLRDIIVRYVLYVAFCKDSKRDGIEPRGIFHSDKYVF